MLLCSQSISNFNVKYTIWLNSGGYTTFRRDRFNADLLTTTLFDADPSHCRFISMQTHFDTNRLKALLFNCNFFPLTRAACVSVFSLIRRVFYLHMRRQYILR